MLLSIMPDIAPKTAGKSRTRLEVCVARPLCPRYVRNQALSAASIDSKIQGKNLPVEDAGTEATTQERVSHVNGECISSRLAKYINKFGSILTRSLHVHLHM